MNGDIAANGFWGGWCVCADVEDSNPILNLTIPQQFIEDLNDYGKVQFIYDLVMWDSAR